MFCLLTQLGMSGNSDVRDESGEADGLELVLVLVKRAETPKSLRELALRSVWGLKEEARLKIWCFRSIFYGVHRRRRIMKKCI